LALFRLSFFAHDFEVEHKKCEKKKTQKRKKKKENKGKDQNNITDITKLVVISVTEHDP
jgi:hypothetical protein